MNLNMNKELAILGRMTTGDLVAKYAEVFGESTKSRHKGWLLRRIAWRMQALETGGISERARRRAAELANDAELRLSAPKERPKTNQPSVRTTTLLPHGKNRLPVPGSVITRAYKGEVLAIQVLTNGFEFEGEAYKSLSAVAKKITGQHCSGFHFFRLGGAK